MLRNVLFDMLTAYLWIRGGTSLIVTCPCPGTIEIIKNSPTPDIHTTVSQLLQYNAVDNYKPEIY